jgi:YebC/PmpR family DNA-binding regulatory protein
MLMAGHSKWANIKHRKGAQDAKRGKVFTKIIREIAVAAKNGTDPKINSSLRLAIEKAFQANMAKDKVQKAIAKAQAKDDPSQQLESIVYEGYGPGGAAMLVHCLTDNRNRTVAEVRHAFSKHQGNLGESGSVSYLFEQLGQIQIPIDDQESVWFDLVMEHGAVDWEAFDDHWLISTEMRDFETILQQLRQANAQIEMAEICWISKHRITISATQAEQIEKLYDRLDDLDDSQSIYYQPLDVQT